MTKFVAPAKCRRPESSLWFAAEGSSAEVAEVLRRLLGKLQLWSRIRRTTQQVH